MLVPAESSSAVLVMICSKSVSVCNMHSLARLVDSSRNSAFWRGYSYLMRSYGGLLERRRPKLTLLKSTFNAENLVLWLSLSISNDFGAFQSWNGCGSVKSRKIYVNPLFLGFSVFQGYRCWYHRKARQQCLLWYAASLCLSATVLTLDKLIVVK